MFLCYDGAFEPDWEAILFAWVTRQQNDVIVGLSYRHHACDRRHAHL